MIVAIITMTEIKIQPQVQTVVVVIVVNHPNHYCLLTIISFICFQKSNITHQYSDSSICQQPRDAQAFPSEKLAKPTTSLSQASAFGRDFLPPADDAPLSPARNLSSRGNHPLGSSMASQVFVYLGAGATHTAAKCRLIQTIIGLKWSLAVTRLQ